MNSDDLFLQSRFSRWCTDNAPLSHERERALREEALGVLVESIVAGEITSLDGIDTPLSRRIKAHHQLVDFEMNSNWVGSSQAWTCPCCSRSKFQISRVGNKRQILAKLVIHHDHMREALEAAFLDAFKTAGTQVEQAEGQRLIERMGNAFAAYEEVLVCEDCNNADTAAKKLVASPSFFSFSPGQIRRFIRCEDHQPHHVEASVAQQVWQEVKPAYELRMRLIRAVAHAAATDAHWYEPYPRRTNAVPTLGRGHRFGDHSIQQWVSSDALYAALNPARQGSARKLSRWRTENQKPGKVLPDNFLAMLRSDEDRARVWESVPDDWHCPICKRSKQHTVYVGGKGKGKDKISFYLKTTSGRGTWGRSAAICNHCSSTLMSLKLEVSDLIGRTPADSFGFVGPEELARIVVPRAHSPHSIRSAEAAVLVSTIVRRLS